MKIVPFEPEHFEKLILQPSQAIMQPFLSDREYATNLARAGQAFTAIDGNDVVCCAGVIAQHPLRAIAWAVVSKDAGTHFVQLTKAIKRFLELTGYKRIETAVSTDFEQGHRWAKLLGFEREGTMKSYAPNGDDYDLYARIKHG